MVIFNSYVSLPGDNYIQHFKPNVIYFGELSLIYPKSN